MSDRVHAPVGVAAMKGRAHKIANLLFRGPTTLEWSGRPVEEWYEHILAKAFAAVAAETREACARVADDYAAKMRAASAMPHPVTGRENAIALCKQDAGETIAAAIRALAPTSPPR